jgi:hypothetical protein
MLPILVNIYRKKLSLKQRQSLRNDSAEVLPLTVGHSRSGKKQAAQEKRERKGRERRKMEQSDEER